MAPFVQDVGIFPARQATATGGESRAGHLREMGRSVQLRTTAPGQKEKSVLERFKSAP